MREIFRERREVLAFEGLLRFLFRALELELVLVTYEF